MTTPEERRTVCNRDCPDACAILATVEDGRVTRLRGDPDHPITRGSLCFRTHRFLERQYSTERLRTPLMRKDGVLAPVSWDEALDHVAERLMQIRRESGPAAIFHYRSGGSLGLLKHVVDRFFAEFGPVTTKRGDICSGAGDAAQMEDFGVEDSHDIFDLLRARNIVLWGKNAAISSPHILRIVKEAKKRGAEVVLIDPIANETAHHADRTYTVRPGGDFALAMATIAVCFRENWIDPDLRNYCNSVDALRALASSRTVEAWCEIADVACETAIDLAERFGKNGPTAILVGWGLGRRANGSATVRALDALSAISGNIGVQGGGVSFYFKRRAAFDVKEVAPTHPPPRTILEPFFGREVIEARDPPIRAVFVTCGNPVAMLPDSHAVARALSTRELVVVVDSFPTDTAACASVVLPTTTLLEDDDLLGSYGHHYIGASRPVVARPEGVRTDLEIVALLASRVGLGTMFSADARAWKERLIATTLVPHGIGLRDLESGAVKSPFAHDVLFADRKFRTPSGKMNLIDEAPAMIPAQRAEFPFALMALSTKDAQSSQWATRMDAPAPVRVHPSMTGTIADGELAILESALGRLTVRVRHDPKMRRDVVAMAKGGHLANGTCANAITRAALTDDGEGAALYDEPVRLVPFADGRC